MNTTIIGIDCATRPEKLGFALGDWDGERTAVLDVTTGKSKIPASIIYDWIRNCDRALLAIDAPLGWPAQLGNELVDHIAGNGIEGSANRLFRRATDRFIKRLIGKQSLDVGADRIARTAHSALALLTELRSHTKRTIPLAWSPNLKEHIQAIEVYPAGTLTALGLPNTGYKKPDDAAVREKIRDGIREHLDLSRIPPQPLLENADMLDAVICVLAAQDFLDGRAVPPVDQTTAIKEGWIWIRTPAAATDKT